MSTYKYADGALEAIETPELLPELKWGPVGHPCPREGEDYAWYCGLPSEGLSAGLAEGSLARGRMDTGLPDRRQGFWKVPRRR